MYKKLSGSYSVNESNIQELSLEEKGSKGKGEKVEYGNIISTVCKRTHKIILKQHGQSQHKMKLRVLQ